MHKLILILLITLPFCGFAQTDDNLVELPDSVVLDKIIQAEFPGGETEMMKFLADNTHYPVVAKDEEIQGKVFMQFTVDFDGSIKDVTVLRSIHLSLDTEAIRVIQSMPKWTPGAQNGKNIAVTYILPITFSLN